MNARIAVIGLVVFVALSLGTAPAGADTIAYNVPAGTIGTQAFAGPLGMDFDVNQPIFITQLGVFDHDSAGVSTPVGLNRDLTARLWDRSGTPTLLETLQFTNAVPGTLIGGSRFKPLAAPLYLPAGFQGTIVGENYGTGELNGNSGGAAPTWTTNGGGGLVSFVGTSPYGTVQGTCPVTPGGGPANRYATGTFAFAEVRDIEPGVGTPMYVANPSFELPGRTDPYYGTDTVAWTSTGSAGDYHVSSEFSDPVPDGTHVAFANANASLTSDPIQGETLQADTLYILQAQWGSRTAYTSAAPLQSMALRAGGVELGVVDNTDVGNGPDAAAGKFETARGYFTANHNAPIGSALDIVLTNQNSPTQPAWDDVRLVKISDAAIEIDNHSFELPTTGTYNEDIDGWDELVPGGGVFRTASQITPADGLQTAFVRGGGSIFQTLDGEPLKANHRYFLLVEVGDRLSSPSVGYQVELLAGGQQIAIDNDSLLVKQFTSGAGEFLTTSVIELHVSGGHPLIGQDLGIRLTALGTGVNHTYFDNVRLFAQPIPEPQTFVLLALGMLGMLAGRWRKRRR